MPIPSSQQWMNDTKLGIMKPRSTQLQALDAAILQYERSKTPDNLWKVKNAFEDWKRSKGAVWQTSERNRGGAMTRLDQELSRVADSRMFQLTSNRFSMQELQALAFMASERKKVIKNLFAGKEVTFRNSPKAMKQAVQDASENVKAKCTEAKNWITGHGKQSTSPLTAGDIAKKKLEEMAKSFFQVDTLETLGSLSGFIIDIIGKCGVSVAPVVGHIKDGYDLFTGWAKAGSRLHEQYSISNKQYAIDTGAPAAAFSALKVCLKEETKHEVASATAATTSFALKTGLLFVDGGAISGPVVGAANAVATLSMQLYWLATEWKATRGINTALQAGDLDVRLFRTYPLMGCYMLCSATFSDLIPIDNFGTPGWMDYVENLKKRAFDGIYESSNDLIDKSPWEIKGLPKRPVKGGGLQTGMISGLGSGAKDLGSNIKDLFS
jgi:hypothetical protein